MRIICGIKVGVKNIILDYYFVYIMYCEGVFGKFRIIVEFSVVDDYFSIIRF